MAAMKARLDSKEVDEVEAAAVDQDLEVAVVEEAKTVAISNGQNPRRCLLRLLHIVPLLLLPLATCRQRKPRWRAGGVRSLP